MSTMEAELIASAFAMKKAVFCSNMLTEIGFGKEFAQGPLYISTDNNPADIGTKHLNKHRFKHLLDFSNFDVNNIKKNVLLYMFLCL